MYYRSVSTELFHMSYVFDTGHNVGSVYAFLKQLFPRIQEDEGVVRWVHNWTDSPSSQYRNKTIFYLVSDHKHLLGIPAI